MVVPIAPGPTTRMGSLSGTELLYDFSLEKKNPAQSAGFFFS